MSQTTTQSKFHDTGYKELFSYPEMVQALIEGFLPKYISGLLDFSTLTPHSGNYITPLLDEVIEDVVWSAQMEYEGQRYELYLHLLIEFQSTVDSSMPLRMLHYSAEFYRTLTKNGKVPKGGPYPPVLPLVLYNGSRPWRTPTNMLDQIQSIPSCLRPYQPTLEYILIDESRYSDADLQRVQNPISGVFSIENAQDKEQLKQAVYRLVDLVKADANKERLDQLLTIWIKRYLQRQGVKGNIEQLESLVEEKTMLAENMEKWRNDAKLEGKLEQAIQMVKDFNLSVKEVAEKYQLPLNELMERLKQNERAGKD